MTKEEFYKNINERIPVRRKSDSFLEDISAVYQELESIVSDLDVADFVDESSKDKTIQTIKRSIEVIKNILLKYYDGCHGEAFSMLKSHLLNNNAELLDLSFINIPKTQDSGIYFYRARKNNGSIKTFKDMFHIPNTRREIVKTERFSVPGYPCLYLGNTVFDCWEEMGKPSFDELFFSGYKVLNEFYVYNLRKPKFEDFEKDRISKTLERLVYVIACQFIMKNHDAPFKPEYIIPQLIMEIIVSINRKKLENESGPFPLVWGVLFTSTCLSDGFQYQEDYLENIAIPVVDTENEHCGYLASLFEVSEPVCYRYEELKERQAGLSWESIDENQEDKIRKEYELTKLGFIEKRLRKNTKYAQLDHIILDCPRTITFEPAGGTIEVPVYSNGPWHIEVKDG